MRKKNKIPFVLLTILGWALFLVSCEDRIYPALESAGSSLVVDAWINNKPETQVIALTLSQSYFDGTVPPGALGAAVTVSDDKGVSFVFVEDDKQPGRYLWKPPAGQVLGTVGNKYKLSVLYKGETFEAFSQMGRVPAVDSITFETTKRANGDPITRGEFWATDPAGRGDAYWIRTSKNQVLLNKPSEINVAYDAGFSSGGATDGVMFIAPIRRRINSNDEDANGRLVSPINSGDSLNVQIYSITVSAFDYLNQVAIQTNRPGGFAELFSRPLANVPTNISNVNPDGNQALGFFNVAAVSTAGKRYKK